MLSGVLMGPYLIIKLLSYKDSVENIEGSEHVPGGHVKLTLSVLTKKGG